MKPINQQKGAVLLVSLMLLVVMTLLAVTSINTSTINLRIVENMQAQQRAENAVDNAIEQILSDITYFNTHTSTPTFGVNGLTVNVAARECLQALPATGYSAVWSLVPEDTNWEVEASVTDSATGAQTVIHQGVTIRLPAGSCP